MTTPYDIESDRVKKLFEACAYNIDCQLATLDRLGSTKSSSKREVERHCAIISKFSLALKVAHCPIPKGSRWAQFDYLGAEEYVKRLRN